MSDAFESLIPPWPDVPEGHRATGESPLRYEDVSQEGRLLLVAVPQVLGGVLWPSVIRDAANATILRQGIVPILTRFVIEGAPDAGPIAVHRPLHVDACFQPAHRRGEGGAVEALYLNMWAAARAPKGRTYESRGEHDAAPREPIVAARLFAEHVFTRLFAPPGERRVVRLPEAPGVPPSGVPEAVWRPRPWDAPLALPDGATPLDEGEVADAAPIAFGLDHTDSNQHVNSLVYQRLFIDAALRRLAAHGRSTAVVARRLEIGYRKPLFAGERARITTRAFMTREGLAGVAGAFRPEGDEPAKGYAAAQVIFSP